MKKNLKNNFYGVVHKRGMYKNPTPKRKKENESDNGWGVRSFLPSFLFVSPALLVSYYKTFSMLFKPFKHDYTNVLTETLTEWWRKYVNAYHYPIMGHKHHYDTMYHYKNVILLWDKCTYTQAGNAVPCNLLFL